MKKELIIRTVRLARFARSGKAGTVSPQSNEDL